MNSDRNWSLAGVYVCVCVVVVVGGGVKINIRLNLRDYKYGLTHHYTNQFLRLGSKRQNITPGAEDFQCHILALS